MAEGRSMIIYWIEDYLSGEVIEQKFYSEKSEAVDRRNALGYGFVFFNDTATTEIYTPSIPY
jgi:hypothetical protein